jgi:Leucine-rich repeat (LRR) protein
MFNMKKQDNKMLDRLLIEAIKLIVKLSVTKLERNQKVINILNRLGIDRLKEDFDSVYIHALVEFAVDGKPLILLEVLAEKEVITAFKKQLYDKKQIREFNSTIKAYLMLGRAKSTIDNLDKELKQFRQIFLEITNKTRTPKELEIYNKILSLEQSNLEQSYEYQVEQYLNRKKDELNLELNKKIKYVDLNGEVRVEKNEIIVITKDGNTIYIEEPIVQKDIKDIYHPIDVFINKWINNSSKKFLLILGEYGTGKSTLCKHVVSELMENLYNKSSRVINDSSKRTPLLFDLRNYKSEQIEEYIVLQLNKNGIRNISAASFLEKMNNGEYVLVLDGFDEMAEKIDTDEKRKNFYQIQKLVDTCKGAKIILTSRQEYFKSDEELNNVVRNIHNSESDLVNLLIFDEEQIKQFLIMHTNNPDETLEIIQHIPGLSELASRAVLLKFIIDHFPIILSLKNKGKKITASDIYKICINNEIDRKITEIPNLGKLIPSEKRLKLLEKLSVWMFLNDTLNIDVRYIIEKLNLEEYFETKASWELEKYLNQFLTFTFLIRISNNIYQISHKSFRDYLVAKSFLEEINSRKFIHFSEKKTSDEINNFIVEQNPNKENLINLLQTAKELKTESRWQGTNSIRLLLALDNKVLENKNLDMIELYEVNLKSISMQNFSIQNSILNNCTFNETLFDSNFIGADFSYSIVDIYNYDPAQIITKLTKLKNLYSLSILSNELTQFPKEITELINLQELSLTSNQLKELPKEIAELKNLRALSLGYNELTEIPKEIAELKNLTTLALYSNKLTEIPKEIAALNNLVWLALDSNELSKLPKEIAELKNLMTLYLDHNQFIEIPKEISELKNLQKLDLDSNHLTELPKEITELKNLQMLYLNSNQLTEIPKEITELKNLQTLSLNSNQLTELPKEIAELKNLRNLYLDSNQLTEIPKEITELKNLQTLSLDSNQLTELPKEIGGLKNLQDLNLNSNQLTELPKEFSELKNLQSLDLSGNNILEEKINLLKSFLPNTRIIF